jgi:hypothetical protein
VPDSPGTYLLLLFITWKLPVDLFYTLSLSNMCYIGKYVTEPELSVLTTILHRFSRTILSIISRFFHLIIYSLSTLLLYMGSTRRVLRLALGSPGQHFRCLSLKARSLWKVGMITLICHTFGRPFRLNIILMTSLLLDGFKNS